jgi:hypothetical protein
MAPERITPHKRPPNRYPQGDSLNRRPATRGRHRKGRTLLSTAGPELNGCQSQRSMLEATVANIKEAIELGLGTLLPGERDVILNREPDHDRRGECLTCRDGRQSSQGVHR